MSFKILVTETRNGSTYSWHDAACCVDEMADGDGTRHDTAALGVYHQPCHGSENGYYFSWQLSSSLDAGWLAVFKYVQLLSRRLLRGAETIWHWVLIPRPWDVIGTSVADIVRNASPKKSLQLGTVVYFAQESPYLGPWAPGQAKL